VSQISKWGIGSIRIEPKGLSAHLIAPHPQHKLRFVSQTLEIEEPYPEELQALVMQITDQIANMAPVVTFPAETVEEEIPF
jgi:hypothetical protein